MAKPRQLPNGNWRIRWINENGLRRSKVFATKADADFKLKERQLITVQRSFDKPTKSGAVRYVPLLDQLKTVLQSRKLRVRSAFVFPDADGSMLNSWHRIFEEDLHLILEGGKFESTLKPNGDMDRYIVFHSLRHTFASHWVMNGGDIFKLQKILGHASIQMSMRYAHLAPQAFADDLNRFSMINTAAAPAKVIELRENQTHFNRAPKSR